MNSQQWPRLVCEFQDRAFQSPDLPKIIAWALEADTGANLGLFHELGRMGFLLWPGLTSKNLVDVLIPVGWVLFT